MPEGRTRFDPVGWFASACFGLLFGAVALAVAVHLIQAIWPWLIGIIGVSLGIGLLARLALARYRRQQW